MCEDCHERKATIHLTRVVGGKQSVLNLCSKCAAKRGFENPLKNVPFPLGDFLSSMVDKSASGDVDESQAQHLARKFTEVPGVAEVVVIAEEGVAYLKVDRHALDEEALAAVAPAQV